MHLQLLLSRVPNMQLHLSQCSSPRIFVCVLATLVGVAVCSESTMQVKYCLDTVEGCLLACMRRIPHLFLLPLQALLLCRESVQTRQFENIVWQN